MTHQNCLKLTDLTDSKSLFLLFCSQDLERMTGNKDILPAVVELDHFECIVPENDLSDKLTVTLKQDQAERGDSYINLLTVDGLMVLELQLRFFFEAEKLLAILVIPYPTKLELFLVLISIVYV